MTLARALSLALAAPAAALAALAALLDADLAGPAPEREDWEGQPPARWRP